MTIHDEATPTQHTTETSPASEPAPVTPARVRDLVHELARIQDQLTAEDHATGARPSPGSTRRRAQLLRRERDVIRQLRARDQHHNGGTASRGTAHITPACD